jgi:hypothetical protein
MTSYNINPTARSFDLVAEALHYLANKISALKEQEEQWQEQNEEEDMIIEEINDYVIAKDLDENAQRLEEIARDFIPLLSQRPFPLKDVIEYINSNENLITFALNVYENDLLESKSKIQERIERMKDGMNVKDAAYKELFFEQYCKTENLDRLLANIEDFDSHNLGRRLS